MQCNGSQHFNRTIFYFLKFEIFSKNYCILIFQPINFLRLETGLLDSLYRHRNGSEDTDITIFSIIPLNFAIDFIFFKFFRSFSELIGI